MLLFFFVMESLVSILAYFLGVKFKIYIIYHFKGTEEVKSLLDLEIFKTLYQSVLPIATLTLS